MRTYYAMSMTRRFSLLNLFLLSCLFSMSAYAQTDDGLGQTIQIYTRFHSFVGKPSWLLIVRDLDHGDNIPYLFDITKGNNYWVAFTFSRNYLISASHLQISSYQPRFNEYRNFRINNFCDLESEGRIIRGKSIYITIDGDLSPYSDTYTCNVSEYADTNFTIANSY